VSYVGLDCAGGSGYLGVFLAGLVVGNMEMLGLDMHTDHRLDLEIGTRNLTDLVTMFVFVIVGANIRFDVLGDELLPELAVVAVLLLVARALTVAACMLPDRRSRWTRAELTFVAWTRETGVVPPGWPSASDCSMCWTSTRRTRRLWMSRPLPVA
jgi:cell volume regulation protein A